MRNFFTRILKELLYLIFIISMKFKKQNLNNKIANIFLNLNNKIVLKKLKTKKNGKILILLPHCLQFYDCEYKVTSNIENCRNCKKCVISNFLDLKKLYKNNIEIKIATGGTLARKFVKDLKPSLILAVACKRDLISGIKDAEPFPVYGIFNEILGEPCINTTVSIKKIYEILEKINSQEILWN